MIKNICIAQTVNELRYILNKDIPNIYVVPLDLEVQIYCLKEGINYLDPIDYINTEFHRYGLIESEKLINSIKYKNIEFESHQIIVKTFIGFRFNSIIYLIYLLKKIYEKNKVGKIVVSGWNTYRGEYSENNYFISSVLKIFFKKKDIIFLSEEKIKKTFKTRSEFEIKGLNSKKKKYVLLTNIGYNFYRFIKFFKNKDYVILAPEEQNLHFLKKIALKNFFNVIFFRFKNKFTKKKITRVPNIKISYKNKKFVKILYDRFDEERNNLINLITKCNAIDGLFEKVKILKVISNNVRGEQGYYLERATKNKINSICVPHGTISENFDKYDRIYKKNISEAIIFNKASHIASQSNISKKFFQKQKNKFNSKIIESGNLIFCQARERKKNNKIKILFAVTLKNFFNIQFLGVEMYYEFLDNLKFLNKFAKENNIKIYVNLHPAGAKSRNNLQIIFPELNFTSNNLTNLLKKVDITLSFSSSVIEDSLNSFVPVILLDRWKRYKHCISEKNFNKRNSAVYYLNDENNLLTCIKTIKKSKKINFSKYISKSDFKDNIKKFIRKIK